MRRADGVQLRQTNIFAVPFLRQRQIVADSNQARATDWQVAEQRIGRGFYERVSIWKEIAHQGLRGHLAWIDGTLLQSDQVTHDLSGPPSTRF